MKKMLGLLMMMLFAVCISSCGKNYARPDRCICDTSEPVAAEPAAEPVPVVDPEPVPQPEPEPEPEQVQAIKEVIQEAIKEDKKEIKIDFEKLAKSSLFEFNSDKVSQDSYAGLDFVASFLKENPNVTVKVEGHTDNVGRQLYNQKLSERRAKSVADYIISKGVDSERVSTQGFGFSRPIASNDTSEGRAKNRRTELVFTIKDMPKPEQQVQTITGEEIETETKK